MFSALAVALVVMGAEPVQVPDVTNSDEVKAQMGNKVTLVGQVERVPIGKGQNQWQGTAVVLDDDTVVYLSYGPPTPVWQTLIGWWVRVEGTLRPSLSEHEQSLIAPHLRDPGVPKVKDRWLGKWMGKRVRISGTAENAKGGALLMINQANTWYLEGLASWPEELVGKQVAVGGKLVNKQYLAQAGKNEKGEWTQGAEGTQNVIEAPTWRLLQDPKESKK